MMSTQSATNDRFSWHRAPWGRTLQCDALSAAAVHCFTGRDLALPADGRVHRDAWDALAASLGVAPTRLYWVRQVHGAAVACADDAEITAYDAPLGEADVVVGRSPDTAIAVRVADCVPLLMSDPRTGAAAAAHAGWRGTASRVPLVAVRALADRYGADPANLVVAIGPSIGACCYQVGPEVRAQFHAAGHPAADLDRWFTPDREGRWRLDLWQACRDQVVAAGVAADRVHVAGVCTASDDWCWSYRREGARAGRMVAAIRPGPAG